MERKFKKLVFSLIFSMAVLIFFNNCSSNSSNGTELGQGDNSPNNIPPSCNNSVGLSSPSFTCSSSRPCKNVTDFEYKELTLDIESFIPDCFTSPGKNHPAFDDGAPKVFQDSNGQERYYCEYKHPEATSQRKKPLVIFFHGLGGRATNVYNSTLLRQKAQNYQVSQSSSNLGFHLISVQGRNLHSPTDVLGDGSQFDFYHRNFESPSSNPDINFLDQIIDRFVSEDLTNPDRIFLIGWSSGGYFAQLYGIARHTTSTPEGNNIAGVAAYSAANPLEEFTKASNPECQLNPMPQSNLPLFLISRSCDIVTCSQEQYDKFLNEDRGITPFMNQNSWINDLNQILSNTNYERQIVLGNGTASSECTVANFCSWDRATWNHLKWIDGISDGSGNDYEINMLNFLRDSI